MSDIPIVGNLYRKNDDKKLFQLIDIKNTFQVHWNEGPMNDTIYTLVEVFEKDKLVENGCKVEILDYMIYKYTLEKDNSSIYKENVAIDIHEEIDNHQEHIIESKESVMKELEEKGEKDVIEMFQSNLSVSNAQDHLLNIMKNGIDEYEKRTGSKMSYSEMRMMYG
jgi:hypothetical protein